MKVTIEINCDSAAFDPEPGQEIGRILELLATQFRTREYPTLSVDANGNDVGKVTVYDSEGV